MPVEFQLTSLGIVSAIFSWMAVGGVRRLTATQGILDVPNARSSHTVPTPRGGGLGVILTLLLMASGLFVLREISAAWLFLVGIAAVATIGWIDDRASAGVRTRLLVHGVSALSILPLLPSDGFSPTLLVGIRLWWVFWAISAINVVNFVDGIDGMIASQILIYGAYIAVVGDPRGAVQFLGVVLAGASLGFLFWNWTPAKIFLGDVGSGALGLAVVGTGAMVIREGRVGFVAAFAPLAPIFFDAARTLWSRWRRGERLSDAHRSHLYQRLANQRYGHAPVSLSYAAVSLAGAVVASVLPQSDLVLLPTLLVGCGCITLAAERYAIPRSSPSPIPRQ
jgi:Fuc2NAc and GlcNAc transferase